MSPPAGGDRRPLPPILTGRVIDQIGVVVPSLERAVASQLAVAPGSEWNVWEYGPETVTEVIYRGATVSASWRAALNTAAPQLELIESLTGPNIYTEWADARGYGLHHLGVVLGSGDSAFDEMIEAGYQPLQLGHGFGLDGDGRYAYFDTAAELGFLLELIVRPARRRTPLTTYGPRVTAPR